MKYTFLLREESKLHEAIEALDRGGVGLLAFVDQEGVLIGILTDGDLRRAVLKKNDDLHLIINRSPLTMSYKTEKCIIVAELRKIHRRHMLLVDERGVLKSIFLLDDIEFVSKENTIVIMAGGLGSRLGHLTKNIPKPLLNIGDRPILRHIIEHARDQGFRSFILCVNYKKELIYEYFGDGTSLGVNIQYIEENKRMGTAGALGLISRSVLNKSFIVINGDVITNLDFDDLLAKHKLSNSVATMCTRRFKYQIPYGVVEFDSNNKLTNLKEKPIAYYDINAGVYVVEPLALSSIPKDKFYDMTELFDELIYNGYSCHNYNVDDYWLDIGKVDDYKQADDDFSLYRKNNK